MDSGAAAVPLREGGGGGCNCQTTIVQVLSVVTYMRVPALAKYHSSVIASYQCTKFQICSAYVTESMNIVFIFLTKLAN
jgi:hypothetical protein